MGAQQDSLAGRRERLRERMEDHALEAVPADQRQGGLQLAWTTTGIVSTLIQMFFGALVCFVAGLPLALACAGSVLLVGTLTGLAVGHVSFRTGLSSTLLSRQHGLGVSGSALASIIYAFMIIGFLALENALIYHGCLFYFGLEDTLASRVGIYGLLSIAWIALTAFGFRLVARVSSILLVAFLLVLAWMLYGMFTASGMPVAKLVGFGSQFPPAALAAMGISTTADKAVFTINVLLGSAGALSLLTADVGRYARSTLDVGIATFLGNLMQSVVMMSLGGMAMYAGMDAMVGYYMDTAGLDAAAAARRALQSPDSVAATFIVFGGLTGTVLMLLAQSKAQVLNTYSASLALANLADAAGGWRPGRLSFVVLANIIALLMLYGRILALVEAWITLLGVVTAALAGVIIADYYLRPRGDTPAAPPRFHLPGIAAIVLATVGAHYWLVDLVPIEFLSAIGLSAGLYWLLCRASRRFGRAAIRATP